MTQITISDDKCWLCGKEFNNEKGMQRTTHHVLPQQLKPVKNILIPIHQKCHTIITSNDISSITTYTYRITKETIEIKKSIDRLTTMLLNNGNKPS